MVPGGPTSPGSPGGPLTPGSPIEPVSPAIYQRDFTETTTEKRFFGRGTEKVRIFVP